MFNPVPIDPAEEAPRRSLLARFRADCSGATAIEYGLIVGMIALAVTPTIRNAITKLWDTVVDGVNAK
ncbi:hypothetical protein MGN01_34760 [Methylobacterium gnaphalii]|uniref:Pilin n=1 Tax=Methylobacterium gnaphalii TaxID=1010610 RepID=A0A512JNU7_9HYPH|nr:hypothetical protein MGN01_34760 [Methylobacterium gnaphalii]